MIQALKTQQEVSKTETEHKLVDTSGEQSEQEVDSAAFTLRRTQKLSKRIAVAIRSPIKMIPTIFKTFSTWCFLSYGAWDNL